MPSRPLLLYSTNTWLAYVIAERYFRGRHWVWCSPFFRPSDSYAAAMPPSAIPGEIYDRLHEDVSRGDHHSGWVASNKLGLIRGAASKETDGVISFEQRVDIESVVTKATVTDFKPLVYVMPYARVKRLLREVPPAERAHPMSVEYVISELPRAAFDVLEPRR